MGIIFRRFAIALLLVVAPLARGATPAPEGPALLVFKQWLEVFNSGDRAKVAAFWQKYGQETGDDRPAMDLRLREMTGGMTIFRLVEATDRHLVALMKEGRGSYSESTLDLATTDPPKIARLLGHPVPAPQAAGETAATDEDLADKVRKHLAELQGGDAFSGAVLIAHEGKVVLEEARGMADNARQIRNTPETQFCIGSMNKMFTAVAILQLVQQGKLALDRPIAEYWPDYPNRDLARRVTIRQLLSHTGGTGDIFTPEYSAHRLETRRLSDYVQLFGERPVRFEPGTRMEYSNYGFILLGRLIELVSGETYETYVRKHVYLPAGMLHTDARPESENVPGRAVGYVSGPSGLTPNTASMPWSGTSAGGGYSTVGDLLRFAEALNAGKLLNTSLMKAATTDNPVHPRYGLGFYVLGDGGYGHSGGAPGINGELHILPRRGYVIVALANRDPRMATNIVDFISSILPSENRGASSQL